MTRNLPQRRFFQPSRNVYKPPANAAAQDEQNDSILPLVTLSPRRQRGWAKATFSSELTPEELKIREALQPRSPPTPKASHSPAHGNATSHTKKPDGASQPIPQRPPQSNSFSQQPHQPPRKIITASQQNDSPLPEAHNTTREADGRHEPLRTTARAAGSLAATVRDKRLENFIRSSRDIQANHTRIGFWDCPNCNTSNSRDSTVCLGCQKLKSRPGTRSNHSEMIPDANQPEYHDPCIARGWEHLRRSTRKQQEAAESLAHAPPFAVPRTAEIDRLSTERARLEELRRARLEEAKNGKFVQLQPGFSKAPSKNLGSVVSVDGMLSSQTSNTNQPRKTVSLSSVSGPRQMPYQHQPRNQANKVRYERSTASSIPESLSTGLNSISSRSTPAKKDLSYSAMTDSPRSHSSPRAQVSPLPKATNSPLLEESSSNLRNSKGWKRMSRLSNDLSPTTVTDVSPAGVISLSSPVEKASAEKQVLFSEKKDQLSRVEQPFASIRDSRGWTKWNGPISVSSAGTAPYTQATSKNPPQSQPSIVVESKETQDPKILEKNMKTSPGWRKWSPELERLSPVAVESFSQEKKALTAKQNVASETVGFQFDLGLGKSSGWGNVLPSTKEISTSSNSFRHGLPAEHRSRLNLDSERSSNHKERREDPGRRLWISRKVDLNPFPEPSPAQPNGVVQSQFESNTGPRSSRTEYSLGSSSPYSTGKNRDRDRKRKRFVSDYKKDFEDDYPVDRTERKRQRQKARAAKKFAGPPTPIYLPEFITVANLAAVLRVRVEDFGNKMRDLGFEETNNDHILDAETAGLIAAEFNFEPILDTNESEDLVPRPPAEDVSLLPARPPIVTIMGHVDHGKTTLLDWLRNASVAASEHGGITQHIGAFSVAMPGGRLITFLDTPGHAAFLSMRQRGANVTDIVILVVAADDSVKPQTVEAIKHAKGAKVPIIVAVNKIDKEDANVERVKQDLARYGVDIEDFGGDTQVVCVSGKTGQGMAELEDAAIALADILDMRAETDGPAEGWVLEATTKNSGRIATVLVRRGTLRPGDVIVAGSTWAKVRCLRDEAGMHVSAAGPGTPIEVDGWREQPTAGDEVLQAPDEQKAKSVVQHRIEAAERNKMATDMTAVNEARRLEQEKRELEKTNEQQLAEAETGVTPSPSNLVQSSPGVKGVFFLIKADVSGSVEAVLNSISALGNSEVHPHIIRYGVGPVTESDINHAAVAKGHIISFNTVVDPQMARMAEAMGVQILDQSIIYRLVDDVKAKLSEQLAPTVTQRVLGEAEVAQVFQINVRGRLLVPVAGCRVRNGLMSRNAKVRVLRGKETVFEGIFSRSLFYFSSKPYQPLPSP